ncbi:hypothetical protein [Longimicrobium sp.]|uniref:hypothetical protein n=1 Tax=Longimicrobium sp. TaxID=2029185 RepID=UPI002CBBEA08|nr:hypothetical protein [Longimicrobium sp.]HSU14270.1 hypothetical protein [Longimicrobium sp.]
MKKIILVCALSLAPAAPVALAAQAVPLPRDTVPTHVPVPLPPSFPAGPDATSMTGHRGGDVLAAAGEGALAGAVLGVVATQATPECAPSDSPGEAAAVGAGIGAVWGGLRALVMGRRARMPPVLVNTPVRGDRRVNAPRPPVVDDRCLGTLPGRSDLRQ